MPFSCTNYGDVSYALSTLAEHWKIEWDQLSGAQQVRVLTDFSRMVQDEDWDSVHDACVEYMNRIFKGNLLSYANSLEASK